MSEFFGEHGESQDLKLSEQEIKMVAKLLSDPTYFPVEFRTWLKNYIEGAGIQVSISQVRGGAGAVVQLPAGIIIPYGGTAIASNVLVCDGVAVSRTLYPALFEAIGTTWGAGDGSTTFNLPDLRDRALYGIGGRVGLAETDGRGVGDRGGPNHQHWFESSVDVDIDNNGYHSHSVGGIPTLYSFDSPTGQQYNDLFSWKNGETSVGTSGDGDHGHGASGWAQGWTSGGYDQDKPSYAGIVYVITTGKGA